LIIGAGNAQAPGAIEWLASSRTGNVGKDGVIFSEIPSEAREPYSHKLLMDPNVDFAD